ncbi:hypothetical protein D3C73_577640 [compost metagenome]
MIINYIDRDIDIIYYCWGEESCCNVVGVVYNGFIEERSGSDEEVYFCGEW